MLPVPVIKVMMCENGTSYDFKFVKMAAVPLDLIWDVMLSQWTGYNCHRYANRPSSFGGHWCHHRLAVN